MERLKAFFSFIRRWVTRIGVLLVVTIIVGGAYTLYRVNIDNAEAFDDPVMHFKYGSTGGDRNFGIPTAIWHALQVLFADMLPEDRAYDDWSAFGFIYEMDENGERRDRPAGTSQRNHMGIDRIFLNCGGCHVGSVRASADSAPKIITGMPSNTVDLQGFQDFLINAALDERFTPKNILAQIDLMEDVELDLINRLVLKFYGVNALRERALVFRTRFRFADWQPVYGPGRFDTFSPAKALLNWPLDEIPEHERIGVVDFPSVWMQRPRDGMQLHWDGNNTKLAERNRSASFGTGALPPILDRPSIERMEEYLMDVEPPSFREMFPDDFDEGLAAYGEPIYADHCASCHGASGRDFTGKYVGLVTPIEEIGTDRSRFDNYTYDLSVNQNVLYAEFGDERFQNFRKTDGYANMPLDGVWLRAPYLHNGSVPTLWDLLLPADERPTAFFRGYDVIDTVNVGFVSDPDDIPLEEQSGLFCFQTKLSTRAGCRGPQSKAFVCTAEACKGNANTGHEYGVSLSTNDKRALIEFLKTF
ncbi:MAG: cytochrome c [Pseudomonadota bacterium]